MGLRPILSSLMRNSAGAIAGGDPDRAHAGHRRECRVRHLSSASAKIGRPSGIDDQNMFALPVTGFEKNFDFFAMVRADMAMLRDMPGVIDAAPINQIPLSGGGSSTEFYSLPDKKGENSPVAYYNTDEHAREDAGREARRRQELRPPPMSNIRPKDAQGFPGTAVVTRAFAEALFPKDKDNLVGKTFYDDQSKPSSSSASSSRCMAPGWAGTSSTA